ncbi:sensor histidine kinase [Edaphobacter aggregans]|uniref:sensor histidine kinase n=1 Tax=Edaphobacter aggregans TaxID=570835 RepID=UPI003CCBC551
MNRVRKWGRTKGGVVCLRVTQRAGRVHLAVADNGCGIEDKIYRKIDNQAHNTSKSAGTGLRLWLSHGIARKHGGAPSCR